MRNTQPTISVFMPVYNGSAFLEESVTSVLKQTYGDFELLLVDDSSTDDSLEILNSFAAADCRVRVFTKENGGIVPKSWNFILPFIEGEFIFYMSQDDLMSPDLFQKMMERQKITQCDTILPDMVFYSGNTNDRQLIGIKGNREQIIDGKCATIYSLDWLIHGFALRKTSLFSDELFPVESFNSDEFMTRKLFHNSTGVAFSEGKFLYRQNNDQAITKTFSVKNYYSLFTLLRLFNFLKDRGYDSQYTLGIFNKLIRSSLTFTILAKNNIGLRTEAQKKEVQEMLSEIKKDILAVRKSSYYNNLNDFDKTVLNVKLLLIENRLFGKFARLLLQFKYKYFTKLNVSE